MTAITRTVSHLFGPRGPLSPTRRANLYPQGYCAPHDRHSETHCRHVPAQFSQQASQGPWRLGRWPRKPHGSAGPGVIINDVEKPQGLRILRRLELHCSPWDPGCCRDVPGYRRNMTGFNRSQRDINISRCFQVPGSVLQFHKFCAGQFLVEASSRRSRGLSAVKLRWLRLERRRPRPPRRLSRANPHQEPHI